MYFYNNVSQSSYRTRSFAAFKVDLSNGGLMELKSLGDNALILGYNASTSVPASKFKGVRSNCFYYTDDLLLGNFLGKGGRKDMAIYNMEDQSHVHNGKSLSTTCPPLWVTPYS
ncbi:hypothetical protein RHMOL_Rhmol02G0286600 [Rhododendron molle]|uniref:Uncharacterized protein n=1 Tax=Rhododendron molle TaxID=49168 RepID=A0ACC0PUV2_RHOML|nr:hypothetical protein RHMOL_Rhmol02G0286600 [Rhododendron molle]